MALALERQDRYLEALAFVENALRAKPDYPEATAFQVVRLIDLNRVPTAAQVLSPALQAHQESAELRNSEG